MESICHLRVELLLPFSKQSWRMRRRFWSRTKWPCFASLHMRRYQSRTCTRMHSKTLNWNLIYLQRSSAQTSYLKETSSLAYCQHSRVSIWKASLLRLITQGWKVKVKSKSKIKYRLRTHGLRNWQSILIYQVRPTSCNPYREKGNWNIPTQGEEQDTQDLKAKKAALYQSSAFSHEEKGTAF